jgi:hypothetical protein
MLEASAEASGNDGVAQAKVRNKTPKGGGELVRAGRIINPFPILVPWLR